MEHQSSRTVELATAFAAGAALLLASLANFLTYNDYPLFRTDGGLVGLGLLVISAAMAPFYVAQRQWGRSILDGFLAMLFADLNTPLPAASIAFGLIVFVIGWRARVSLVGPMAAIGTFVLVTVLVGLGGKDVWVEEVQVGAVEKGSAAGRPALVHLILDEHLGIEGFPESDPDANLLKQQLKSFYSDAGFTVYGGAYSEHMHTANAVPYMLNYGHHTGHRDNANGVEVGTARHLQKLATAGYRITVFQSDFAELCAANRVHSCVTYDSSSLRPTLSVPLTTQERTKLIAWKFVTLSDLIVASITTVADLATLSGLNGELLKNRLDAGPRSSTAASLAALDLLTSKLLIANPGDAFVAHILVPHVPYMVGPDCRYLPRSEWSFRRTPPNIEMRRASYRSQVRCTIRRVGKALRALDQSPAGKNAVVIIHGDHGSRITDVDANEPNFGQFGEEELIATFSTLLAVRAPNVRPHYFPDRQPVAAILRDFAATDFRLPPVPREANVKGLYLDDLDWVVRRRIPLPRSWNDTSPSHRGNITDDAMTVEPSGAINVGGDR